MVSRKIYPYTMVRGKMMPNPYANDHTRTDPYAMVRTSFTFVPLQKVKGLLLREREAPIIVASPSKKVRLMPKTNIMNITPKPAQTPINVVDDNYSP